MRGDLVGSRPRRWRLAGALLGMLVLVSPALEAGVGVEARVQAQPAFARAQPTFSDVCVPARDGTCLAADVYLPAQEGQFPVLFQLTPYNKVGQQDTAEHYLSRGYAVVVADSRGIYASEGKWTPYMNEGRDGYDIQQWIGRQSWSNGEIGMFGCSYPGFTQLLPAPYRSHHVKAILPECAQSDNFGAIWSRDGIYQLALGPAWGTNQEAIASGQERPNVDWSELMWHLPLKTLPEQTGIISPFVQKTIEHDSYGDFWKRMSVRHLYGEMDVPAFHIVGWYDDLLAETFRNYTNMRKSSRSSHARRSQKLLVGPWGHGARPRQFYGDVDFGPEVNIDVQAMRDRWFDYHVKGIKNGLNKEAPISIFVMGANKWRDVRQWPLPQARPTRFYFRSEGSANSRFGDGSLTTKRPTTEPQDRYAYNPRDPVMTHGGTGCCPASGVPAPIGPLDQQTTEERQDVLVYTTDRLKRDVEVTGRPKVRLFFSTDVTDTDFFVRLSDVYPNGKSIVITEGSLRTRFRNSLSEPELLTPNQVYEVSIPLWETSNLFKDGHRIRVHVTSSNFPRFNRNLNSGKRLGEETEDDIRIATQTIYHERQRRSSIVLPLIPPNHKPPR